MKIFNAAQLRAADQYTVEHEPISFNQLMERAATACVQWITERYTTDVAFKVVCGTGNNGGDGLCIARQLANMNYKVDVFVINFSPKRSDDFSINYNRLLDLKKVMAYGINTAQEFRSAFKNTENTVVIDAIFGSGLNKPAEGLAGDVIRSINESGATVIAIDLPSGLYCDEANNPNDAVTRAAYTLTFECPKLSFMFPEAAAYTGVFSVLSIGHSTEYIHNTYTPYHFVTKADAAPLLKTRGRQAHKGNFGHSLLVAGSTGKTGAAVLAAKACLRTGTGLLTVHAPASSCTILQIAIPEAMTSADTDADSIGDNIPLNKYNAIGIGPGIGTGKQTQNALKLLIQNTAVPLVLDADAINILGENKTWLAFVPANSIYTPHPKEFERLTEKAANSTERLTLLREFCIKHRAYVVLKGAHTATGCPDGSIYFNSTGNPGMAKGGSGDVLTGMITALVAQGYTAQHACILGVYLHGLAGDFAAAASAEESMLASDLIEQIGNAYNFVRG